MIQTEKPVCPDEQKLPKNVKNQQQRTDILMLLVSLVIFIAGWEIAVRALHVSPLILPPPSKIGRALWWMSSSGIIVKHLWMTVFETLGGFVVGSAVGIILGALIAHSRLLDRVLYPYIVAFQTLPKVAIAPLMILWFGFGVESKIMMSMLISFFPLLVNTMVGLRSVSQEYVDLMSALAANPWQAFRYVRFPSALPFIFAGLEVGIVLSIIGAIVGEFVGASQGLGYLVMFFNAQLDVSSVFALLVVLGALGILMQSAITWARRRIVFWAAADQSSYKGA